MADPIEIELKVEGTSESAAGVGAVSDKLAGLEAATNQASERCDQLTKELRDELTASEALSQKLGESAGMHRALTDSAQGLAIRVDEVKGGMEAFGSALGTLGSSMQGINEEFALGGQVLQSFGDGIGVATSMPGPLGLALGGLTTAFGVVSSAVDYFSNESSEMAQEVRGQVIPTLDDLISTLRRASSLANQRDMIEMGLGDATTMRAAVQQADQDVDRLSTTLGLLRTNLQNLREQAFQGRAPSTTEVARYEQQIDQVRQQLFEAQQLRERRRHMEIVSNAEAEADMLRQLGEAASNDNGRGRGAAARATREAERQAEQERREAQRAEAESFRLLISEEASWLDQRLWQNEQNERANERAHAAELRRISEADRARRRAAQAEERAAQERFRLERELEQMSEKRIADYQQLTGVITDGLTEALAATIAGTESADDAFKGMLASFLAALSQMAGLEAAKNYARAIEFFSTQRYDQGALAIAAGTAWLGVAVLAGAGSVAVSAPPAASAPASPQSNAGTGGDGGGGTTVINYNAPVVTAGTRAELGREISGLVDDARRRLAA